MNPTIPQTPAPAETARSLHEICEDARHAECRACPALPGDECVFTSVPVSLPCTPGTPMQPVRGYHVARFALAEADGLISIADMAVMLAGAGAFTATTIIYDGAPEDAAAGDQDDDLEPFCTECGHWIGHFFGMDGWHHFRGDPAPGGKRQLYDAGHEASPAWCEPPGRFISPAEAVTLGRALADAEASRRDGAEGFCGDCESRPEGACPDHVDDLDQADAYAALGRQLQEGETDER